MKGASFARAAAMKRFFLRLLLPLLFNFATSSTFPYREVLSLKALSRNSATSVCKKSYIVHRIICLLVASTVQREPAHVLLASTVLDGVLEEEGEVERQGRAFSQMVINKSEGMLSGFGRKLNDGPELPLELNVLFKENALAMVHDFLNSTSKVRFNLRNCTHASVKRWIRSAMVEAVVAWKQFVTNFVCIRCSNKLTKAINSKSSQFDFRERMNMYLSGYEQYLKPTMSKFDLGNSHSKVMTIYYFFQYLHHVSRVYAAYLTNEQINRLKRHHEEFITDIEALVTTVPLQRKFVGSLPVKGRWFYASDLDWYCGVLAPKKYDGFDLSFQNTLHMSLQRISLYRINLRPNDDKCSRGCVHFHITNEGFLELYVYTTRKDADELWLAKLVKQLNTRMSTQNDILEMIYS